MITSSPPPWPINPIPINASESLKVFIARFQLEFNVVGIQDRAQYHNTPQSPRGHNTKNIKISTSRPDRYTKLTVSEQGKNATTRVTINSQCTKSRLALRAKIRAPSHPSLSDKKKTRNVDLVFSCRASGTKPNGFKSKSVHKSLITTVRTSYCEESVSTFKNDSN